MHRPLPPVTTEPVNSALLQQLIGTDARLILEVGANRGQHTRLFLFSFPNARIHAFEPDPRAIDFFRRTVTDRRVTLHEIAIGAENGRAEFHVSNGLPPGASEAVKAMYPKGWDQSGSLRKPKSHLEKWPWCKFPKTIRVDVRTLDTWSKKHEPGTVDFLWADMQGTEADLVAGGRETLARTRFLYTECFDDELYEGAPTRSALLDLLPDWEIVKLYESDMLLRNTKFG